MFLVCPQEGGKLLRWCLQSHPKVTQIAPKSDLRISKWDLWKCMFYCSKTLLLQLPGHPTPSKKTNQMFYWHFCYPKSTKFTKIHRNWIPLGTSKSIKNLYSMGTESATCAIRRSNSAFLRSPEHVKVCQMIPNGFSLSLGWADHFAEAAKTVN